MKNAVVRKMNGEVVTVVYDAKTLKKVLKQQTETTEVVIRKNGKTINRFFFLPDAR